MPMRLLASDPELSPLPAVGGPRSLRRFLAEVFPRRDATDGDGSRGRTDGAGAVRDKTARYGSAFRRRYGHAAYSFVSHLTRMCAGALKGPPLRDLVEACFEGIACRPSGKNSGALRERGGGGTGAGAAAAAVAGGVGGSTRDRGEPHPELTALAVMHAPDLLQCFSEVTAAAGEAWIV